MRPEGCPGCSQSASAGVIIGNGWYPRKVAYPGQNQGILVKRWKCLGCKKTISQLPDFLHRHRHYALAVIEPVLSGRIEAEQTWDELKLTASTRTIRRWVAAFLARTSTWFLAVLSALAQTQPELRVFDPHGAGSLSNQSKALLELGRLFAHWLDPGLTSASAWLRVLWRWGWNAGVGRLV